MNDEQIVTEAMANHDKHYWALVQTLKHKRKGWGELADLIGEGSTVAKAIWNKYENFKFHSAPAPAQGTPEPPKVEEPQLIAPLKVNFVTDEYFQKRMRHLPSEIDSLQQELDFLREHYGVATPASTARTDGWVSVEERLPELDIPVLIWRFGFIVRERIEYAVVAKPVRNIEDEGTDKYWEDWSGDDISCNNVTHWRELPAAPGSVPHKANLLDEDKSLRPTSKGFVGVPQAPKRPKIICLCGSTRFIE